MIFNHGILFIEKETEHLNIIEGIILGSVKKKKNGSQYSSSHFITKKIQFPIPHIWKAPLEIVAQTEDSWRFPRNSQFQNYAAKPRPLEQSSDVGGNLPSKMMNQDLCLIFHSFFYLVV